MTQLDQAFLDRFAQYGPVGKTLSMLVRTAFIAPKGKTLVWGDWSAIEARVLPWLAASPGAEQQLRVFEASDHDKTKPDVYVFNAAQLLGRDPQDMWDAYRNGEPWAKQGRQSHGKVPVLSLGFGGGVGALQAMAVNYHVHLDDAAAQAMVTGWRDANQWARTFWGRHDRDGSSGLWGAVNSALENPGDAFTAGRVAYVYDRGYLGGTLFCALPCGRLLTYPDIKLRTRKFKDKKTGEEVEKTALWYRKGYGWSALWHGKCAENITQAVAGSILRETLVWLDREGRDMGLFDVIGHTHDEALVECDEHEAVVADVEKILKRIMEKRPEWRTTLPLVAEISENWFYTKAEE